MWRRKGELFKRCCWGWKREIGGPWGLDTCDQGPQAVFARNLPTKTAENASVDVLVCPRLPSPTRHLWSSLLVHLTGVAYTSLRLRRTVGSTYSTLATSGYDTETVV
ncbi:hypothetical protein B0I75DRAFT_128836 [Yarrowia lipolytica]|nr:hypothetical protein B0I74DRAFT_174097 [Yarrowia lipolytica]RDW52386.1 hypothetical protein B0I75DRAFT_128836 [Yarrowia lipolytica]